MGGEFKEVPFQSLHWSQSHWSFFILPFKTTAVFNTEIISTTQVGILTHRLDDSVQGG
jgi:hypothetical protein